MPKTKAIEKEVTLQGMKGLGAPPVMDRGLSKKKPKKSVDTFKKFTKAFKKY